MAAGVCIGQISVCRGSPYNQQLGNRTNTQSHNLGRFLRQTPPASTPAELLGPTMLIQRTRRWVTRPRRNGANKTHPPTWEPKGATMRLGCSWVGDASPPAPGAAPSSGGLKPKLTGMDYARKSWANVLSLASKNPALAARVRELPNPDAIREALGTGGSSGSWGYINNNSGWANATASMAWLFDQVQKTGRVNFVAGTVISLERAEDTVTGAKLSDGRVLSADLVVVAAGAWTGSLVDLAGQTVATGQVLGYMDITEAEQEKLANMPVILNISTGLFIIPPTDRVLKIAQHAYGYLNPVTPANPPLPFSPSLTTQTPTPIFLPRTGLTDPDLTIPAAAAADLRRALREMIPWPALHDRPFTKTRLCWYADTADADFLVDYHPHWHGLFVATGDSGHAFKFLPVIGDKVVDCIVREPPLQFRGKWDWKVIVPKSGAAVAAFTEDGTRGGTPGLVLAEALGEVERVVPSV
ncbi:hypothetical protein CHGG_08966 [Chaetomium globosum CBS 148.51]|uniref:FAD dependent oxidoreductase domain-containing protein n=1 Tax=Chaetomium globosum (strain ATCC 6205 / CBS 148.51 / DSM 1962 / NBRC 6347 / NRRL 1970) TaxID=306901 RepID=Q2GST8_CHAGB|nr:uncharacterized protein CHGG_08966 [Chaetomium globosum CBS 148.51]EAQ84952.1 hypothetical protein CHGG_08966 [Chaetomium globosum CBS 148.51]